MGCRNTAFTVMPKSISAGDHQAGLPPSALHRETPKSKLKAQVVAMPNCKVKSPRCPTLQPKVAVFGGGEGHVETG